MLHEMLTGGHLFLAETIPETLAHVMTRQVDLGTLPDSTPRRIRDLLARCLEKDPKKRLRDIGEARIRLEEVISGAADEPTRTAGAIAAAPAGSGTRERIAWGAAVAFALLAAVASAWALRPGTPPPETRLEIATPATDDLVLFRDLPRRAQPGLRGSGGRRATPAVAQTAGSDEAAGALGHEGATYPFWSPDSRSVAFFAAGGTQLKRLDIGSGLLQVLTGTPNAGRGGSWSADGVILFASSSGPLFRVTATGGAPAAVTKLAPGHTSHRSGEPVSVADQVSVNSTFAAGAFAASSTGSITYRTGTSTETQLTWFDRAGKVAGTIGTPDANSLLQPTLSPDGRRVVAYRTVQNNEDLWCSMRRG